MEKEEYKKKKVALGLDVAMKMWLEHHQFAIICLGEPT
jgi:hypothetical protein